ncbi:hypothetical protein OAQ99_05360 [Candidatus Kapabacteria bacterium]|nr:hypothetical protein [Candidatus Kapabacteria bacterium]
MKKGFTPYPMQGYWGKKFGFVIAMISTIYIIAFGFFDLTIFKSSNSQDHAVGTLWLLCFGLFSMMMSKEKVEDERVMLIRAKTMQMFISFLFVPIITIGFFSSFIEGFSHSDFTTLTLILTAFILYNIYFNYSLKVDPNWNYSNGGVIDNIKSTKFIIFLIAVLLLPLIYFLFRGVQ